ncbi:uncharacterized protein [Apostichopus japonicus]|uniref:uncharacterized protein isoform X2 n=1 Tax=Stichopus japonicus TaxID=307972 RepID=UPI003AB87331
MQGPPVPNRQSVPPPVPPRETIVHQFKLGDLMRSRESYRRMPPQHQESQEELDKTPKDRTPCLLFTPPEDEVGFYRTDIAKLLIDHKLPLWVKVTADDVMKGCSTTIMQGTLLCLHFIHRPVRVYTTDKYNNDYYMPLCAQQLYEVLPTNPIHDDRLYPTTRDLINAKPLPLRVRIEEAHFSDHPGEAQEVGDIIEIKGVEKRPVPYDSENPPQKCIIGTCNNVPIAFSDSMDCASYSTMPSVDFMSLSEVVNKFPLPLRIRRADKPDHVLILHRMDEEYHVIATSDKFDHVFSIPISWEGKIEEVDKATSSFHFPSLLPPLYPLVNTTWDVKEPGRRDLQSSMQLVAQPPEGILDSWSRTKEGQDFVLRATKTTVDSYKLRVEELMEEKTRLNNELRLYRTSKPPAPPPRELPTPILPPKPGSFRSPPPSPGNDDDDCEYEEPMHTTNKGKSHRPSSTQLEELKHLVQERERKVTVLQDKVQHLKKENKDLDNKNASLVEHIRRLQGDIDKLEAAGDPTYDSLDANQYAYPSTGPIYSHAGGASAAIKGVKSFNEDAVAGLLREMRLEAHVTKFKENSINGELLCDLDEEDLYGEIGMSRIQAKRLMLEVKKRNKKS